MLSEVIVFERNQSLTFEFPMAQIDPKQVFPFGPSKGRNVPNTGHSRPARRNCHRARGGKARTRVSAQLRYGAGCRM